MKMTSKNLHLSASFVLTREDDIIYDAFLKRNFPASSKRSVFLLDALTREKALSVFLCVLCQKRI